MSSKKKTLPRHMRIAALQCNFEGGHEKTLLISQKWKNFGFNVEQLFHTHSELYTALFDEEKHGKLLGEYLAEEKKNGLSVILYMNCHILMPSHNDKKDEWGIRNRDGSYKKMYDNIYYMPCYNSTWTDHFMNSLASLKKFDLAGIFFDGPVVQECFCPACRNKYENEKNRPVNRLFPDEINDFAHRTFLEFSRKIYNKVKEINPGWKSYTNLGIVHGLWSANEMREILNYEDIVGTEGGFQFYGPPKETPPFQCSLFAKAAESIAGKRPTVIFMAGDHKRWAWYLHTPAETRLCYASAIASGASVWYGIHSSSDLLNSSTGSAVKEMVSFDKRNERFFSETESIAEIALFYSFNTAKYYKSGNLGSDMYGQGTGNKGIGNYMDAVHGAIGLLIRSGIPFDFVTELSLDKLSKYKTIILPNVACLDPQCAGMLAKFIANGGVIIADGETSLFDENGNKKGDFSMGKVFGIKFAGKYTCRNLWDYFVLDRKFRNLISDNGVKYIPAPLAIPNILPRKKALVIASLCPPLAGSIAGKPGKAIQPFITKNTSGKGTAYFIAGTFFEFYNNYGIVHYKEILQNLVKKANPPLIELVNAPEAVEISVRKSLPSEKVLIHLVNYAGTSMSRPISRVIPVRDAELRVKTTFTKARSLVSGKKLKMTGQGMFKLPEFEEFEVVMFE